jgi:hypothetical protein
MAHNDARRTPGGRNQTLLFQRAPFVAVAPRTIRINLAGINEEPIMAVLTTPSFSVSGEAVVTSALACCPHLEKRMRVSAMPKAPSGQYRLRERDTDHAETGY